MSVTNERLQLNIQGCSFPYIVFLIGVGVKSEVFRRHKWKLPYLCRKSLGRCERLPILLIHMVVPVLALGQKMKLCSCCHRRCRSMVSLEGCRVVRLCRRHAFLIRVCSWRCKRDVQSVSTFRDFLPAALKRQV